jgi:HK97 family phage major capsid protein
MTSEFIELLRPATILGRLPFRTVPFNVRIPTQTAGAAAGWVGEGLSKPVQKLDFSSLSIPWAKIAVISVITQELARFSNPAAEMLIRDDLIAAIGQFKDVQLLDPTVTASTGVRPASITNGVTPIAAPADMTVAEIDTALVAALMAMNTALMPMTSPRWIMNGSLRIMLQNLRSSQDVPAYPEVASGMLKGYPIIESNNIPVVAGGGGSPPTTMLVLVDASQILHAEDPVIDVQMSTEASLQMDSAPATPPTPLVSLFQQNLLAIKAEQYEYWVKRRSAAVQVIDDFPIGAPVA